MRISDWSSDVGSSDLRGRQHGGERVASAGGGTRDVVRVHDIHHPFEGVDDLGAAGTVSREHVHETVEGDDVLEELPHHRIAPGELEAGEAIMRRVPGGGAVAQGGGLVLVGHLHRRVGGRLEEETERPPGRYGYTGVERLDRLYDPPVPTVGCGLPLAPPLGAGHPPAPSPST